MDIGVFHIVPVDFIIFFVVWVVFSVVALQGGRGEVISIVLGAFFGYTALVFIPQTPLLTGFAGTLLQEPRNLAILFVILVIAGYLGIRQMMLPYGSDLIGSPTQSTVLGFLSTIILLALWVALPQTASLWQFGSLFQMAFAATYTLFWIIGAFALMVIFG